MEPAIAPEMVAVIPRPEHTVRIVFADGEVRDVDITPLLDTPAFSALRDPAMFSQVKVDEETGTKVSWVRYFASQPWPFPASLMLGFHAHAPQAPVQLDGELEDARWFELEELRGAIADLLPRVFLRGHLVAAGERGGQNGARGCQAQAGGSH